MKAQLHFLLIQLFIKSMYGVKLCVECDTDAWSLKKGCRTVYCDEVDPEGVCYDCPETHKRYKNEEKRKCWKCYGKGCEDGLYHRVKCPSNQDAGYCIDCSGLEELAKDCWTCFVTPTQFCQAISCRLKDEDGTCYKNCEYGVPGNSKPPVFFSRNEDDDMSSSQSYEYNIEDEPITDRVIHPRKVFSENISHIQQKKGIKFHYTHIPKTKHLWFAPAYHEKRPMSFKNLTKLLNNSSSSNTCIHCSKIYQHPKDCKAISCKNHLHRDDVMKENFLSHFKKEERIPLNQTLGKNSTNNGDISSEIYLRGHCYQCSNNNTTSLQFFMDRGDCKTIACSKGVADLYNALFPRIDPEELIDKLNDTKILLSSPSSANFSDGEEACYQCQDNETPMEDKCNEISCSGKLKKDLNSACFRDHIKVPCGVDCIFCSQGVQSVCSFVACKPGDEIMTCYGVCKDWQSL
ncbi:uncharacterized protein [Lepeophtheirus salmonis]|uniref:uncharacterized protein n=1 Tax=Lepeophtheirus salmonis TaxID=72036 RepID=UPI001AEB5955|nr:uncharacterized protein LOC121124744 isoform X1 [Lepeophtheirus salmonis]